MLLKLAEKDKAALAVARGVFVSYNFEVARAVADNFDKLPEEERNEILLKLSEKKGSTSFVAYIVDCNFNKLPEDVRNELLLKLAEKEEATWIVAKIIIDKIPPGEERNKLLLKLAEKKGAARMVANAVSILAS